MVVAEALALQRLVLVVLGVVVLILHTRLARRPRKLAQAVQLVMVLPVVTALCSLERMPPLVVAELEQLAQTEQQTAH
jgi:hypothetical protein